MEIQDKKAKNTSFSRSIIAGLICGIIAAVLNAVYNYYYRSGTGFESEKLINPFAIFTAFPLVVVIAGIIFFEMVEFLKRGRLLFTLLFIVLTLAAILLCLSGTGSEVSGISGLLMGMAVITGLIISFLLPFLATHPKIFMEDEELSESRFIN